MSEMKNLRESASIADWISRRISELEDRPFESSRKRSKKKRNKGSLNELWDIIKRKNTRYYGSARRRREKGVESLFKKNSG